MVESPPQPDPPFCRSVHCDNLLALALLPCVVSGVVRFGPRVTALLAVGLATAALCAWVGRKLGQTTSRVWAPAGMLLPLLLPPQTPLWMVALGVAFGMVFGVILFGGGRRGIFHPVALGCVFLLLSYPSPLASSFTPFETKAALAAPALTGAVLLLILRTIDWRIPVGAVGAFGLAAAAWWLVRPGVMDPVASLTTGSFLFVAFFLATDKPLAPRLPHARWIYGACFGGLAFLFVCQQGAGAPLYALLLANAGAPLLDRLAGWIDLRRAARAA